MAASKILNELRRRCDEPLAAMGFEFDGRRKAYSAPYELGARLVYPRVVHVGGAPRVDLSAALRVTSVVDAFVRATGLPPQVGELVNTIGAQADCLDDWPETKSRMVVVSQADADEASRATIEFVKQAAVPYFEAFSELEAIERLLNSNPEMPSVHSGQPHRACFGVILAKRLSRPDYEEICAKHRRVLAGISRGFYLKELDAVLMWLADQDNVGE